MLKCDLCYEKRYEHLYQVVIFLPSGEEKNTKDVCADCIQKVESFIASMINVH